MLEGPLFSSRGGSRDIYAMTYVTYKSISKSKRLGFTIQTKLETKMGTFTSFWLVGRWYRGVTVDEIEDRIPHLNGFGMERAHGLRELAFVRN